MRNINDGNVVTTIGIVGVRELTEQELVVKKLIYNLLGAYPHINTLIDIEAALEVDGANRCIYIDPKKLPANISKIKICLG